ncbi:MAG: GntR family transcriptional regulator [Defluviitaleaceae bacterium]|nr:GntR family transcriptional regulator [Defluviitaleaceae bacterium]
MFQIDLKSRAPIYEQVVQNFKKLIIQGVLKEDEKIPSVRDMAKTLAINPNTVQKAYKDLESKGYFYTVLGQGSFVKKIEKENATIEQLYSKIQELLQELKFLGESKDEILRRIHDNY